MTEKIIPGGPLRDPVKKTIIPSPFIRGMVPFMLFYFNPCRFDLWTESRNTITKAKDMIDGMTSSVGHMASCTVMILPIASLQ